LRKKAEGANKKEKPKSAYKPLVPAVEQASHILLWLAEHQRKTKLTQICKQVGIHKSKGHSILHTLMQFGFVEKDSLGKTYSLGPNLIFLARSFLDNLSYPEIVVPFLENLARETSATAVFGFISGDHVLVIAKREGNQNIGFTLPIGHRVPITLGAHGKAIVAFMPEKERKKILSSKQLYFFGDTLRIDKKRLQEEFVKCRELGFARDLGEVTPGVNVVSAPVFRVGEKIIGCINLFGTFHQELIDPFGQKVTEIARLVSSKIGADLKQL